MYKLIRTPLKMIGYSIMFVLGFLLLYVIVGLILPYFKVNADFKECETDAVEIYIKTNGVHTDLVVPMKNSVFDWNSEINPLATKVPLTNPAFVGIGWGDKGFYLETPQWSDLKFKTAFNAMFYLSTTAMHVTFYTHLIEDETCIKIKINKESYEKMTKYILESFARKENKTQLIPNASYSNNDLFYEANGTYGLFKTCNTWTNNGLKAANLKACLWTALDKGMFNLYKK